MKIMKIMKILKCSKCQHWFLGAQNEPNCGKISKTLKRSDCIPEWCPLPDYPLLILQYEEELEKMDSHTNIKVILQAYEEEVEKKEKLIETLKNTIEERNRQIRRLKSR